MKTVNQSTIESKLQGLRTLANFYVDWHRTTYANIIKRTKLTTNDISICLRHGLLERNGDKSTGYLYKYAGDRPPNIGTAKKLVTLVNREYANRKAKREDVRKADIVEVQKIEEKPVKVNETDLRALALGQFMIDNLEQRYHPNEGDIHAFLQGFEAGRKS